jgi:hypothetical protein
MFKQKIMSLKNVKKLFLRKTLRISKNRKEKKEKKKSHGNQ